MKLSLGRDPLLVLLAVSNAALCVALWLNYRQRHQHGPSAQPHERPAGHTGADTRSSLAPLVGSEYVPPLPQPVADVLNRTCLCYLATSAGDSPHLSLMRFTYAMSLAKPGSEVLCLTRRVLIRQTQPRPTSSPCHLQPPTHPQGRGN